MFARQRLKLNVDMVSNHLDTIKMMVAIGLGWGVLPVSMLDQSLCPLHLEGPPLRRRLGVVFHSARQRSNPARKFIESLQNGGADSPPSVL